MLFPIVALAQKEEKRTSFFVSTNQGISILRKEALSNTTAKTFPTKPAYAFSYGVGLSIKSKRGKSFSDIRMKYSSDGHGFLNAQDGNVTSSKKSTDRTNYLSIGYQYSRYIMSIKNYRTFLSVGADFSYILNRNFKLKYDDRTVKIKTKGKNISNNFVIAAPIRLSIGYGVEFNKGIFIIGSKSRLTLNLTLNKMILPFAPSSNQYFGTNLTYQILF